MIRTITFLRHVPPRRIARRLWLEAKRRALVAVRKRSPRPSAASTRLCAGSFEPLFPAPAVPVDTTPSGYVFSFLGRSVTKGRIVDWAAPAGGAGDQLWRMNLHYMEYLGGVEDGPFIDLIEQWIAANPPYRPGYWRDAWNAYALSIRATVWMEEFLRRRARLPAAFADRLLTSLTEQLAFLVSNVETDIGGNHLLKNIRALVTAGRVLSGPTADIALQTALRLLPSALDEQVLSDGMHFERSPSYHNQVFADLLAVRQAASDTLQDDIRRRLDAALASMAQVTADLVHPDGHVPLFGDSGLHMAADADGLLAAYARMFGTRPLPRRQFAFPGAGYFGFRDAGTYVVLDCGRLGPDALMAHAHGDALSFELSAAGERIIVDQGVFEYAAGKRRIASRAARSHNTVVMQDLEQGDFFDSFRCGVRPEVELIDHAELPGGVRLEGRHDGFARTGRGPIHRRRFTFANGRLDIHDWLEGPAPAPASSALLLHPNCRVMEERGALLVTRGAARLRIDGSVPFALMPAVYWPDMGIEETTTRIVFHWPRGTSEARTGIEILA